MSKAMKDNRQSFKIILTFPFTWFEVVKNGQKKVKEKNLEYIIWQWPNMLEVL
jgi:hypothetical protein